MSATAEGMDELALPDIERRLSNVMRMGTVAEVDYDRARVKVRSGNLTTAWLPWAAGSANSAKRRWNPPAVDEQVAVLSPGGDMAQGLVLTGIYQQAAAAPANSGDKDTTVYGDGAVIEYDHSSHTLTADLQGTKLVADRTKIELTVGSVVLSVSAAGVSITGGQVTHNGKNIGSSHTHTGVVPGAGTTGAPT